MAEIKRDWKIGDKFRVRSKEQIKIELNEDGETDGIFWSDRMDGSCGKILTVEDVNSADRIVAEANELRWSYAYEWIEPVAKYPWSKYVSVE